MFHVGQRIVCINARFPPQFYDWGNEVPREGGVYTVREMGHGTNPVNGESGPSLLLEEIVNPRLAGRNEVLFAVERFRPLVRAGEATVEKKAVSV